MAVIDRLKDLNPSSGNDDLLNVNYPAPRVTISLTHSLAIAGIVLAAVAAWLFFSARPGPPDPASAFPPMVAESEDEPTDIVVSGVGEVEALGLVTLEVGARVADALEHARPTGNADVLALNQAQLLVDGQQLVVPAMGAAAPPGEAWATAGSGAVSLNSASVAELMTLDGVGEKTAEAIIRHREEIGGFSSLEQLLDVSGIGPAKFEALSGQITL